MLRSISLLIFVILASHSLLGTTLPESGKLKVIKINETPKIDPDLKLWFETYSSPESTLDLKPKQFLDKLKLLDSTTANYLSLRSSDLSTAEQAKALKAALTEVKGLKKDNVWQEASSRPLLPYLLEEILESNETPPEESSFIQSAMAQYGEKSCPAKDYLMKKLGEPEKIDKRNWDQILSEISIYRSTSFRKEAMGVYLEQLPKDKRQGLKSKILLQAKEFSSLVEGHEWLKESSDKKKLTSSKKKWEDKIDANLKKRRCSTAEKLITSAFKKKPIKNQMDTVYRLLEDTGRCFRRRGASARIGFWKRTIKPMAKISFEHEAYAKRRVGLLHWYRDDFKQAKAIFSQLLSVSRKKKDKSVEARAIYTMARIYENEGGMPNAIKYYQDFVVDFPENELIPDARKALVLLYAQEGRTDQALKSANEIIDSQMKLGIDDRTTSTISFAIFWAGRFYQVSGKTDLAYEMWRRLASEYYSTFYGAVAHYVLERSENKFLSLAPNKTSKFDEEKIFTSYSKNDLQTVERIKALLRLGLKEEAACELSELAADEGNYEQIYGATLLKHADGEWLSAIKNFGSLPRSFRNSLAVGSERILFPRAYVESVNDYSKRLSLDPNLIFAIIRQESVFNPKARSPVGARGLMQLMPGTARVEARHLISRYLPKKRRRSLAKSARTRNNLFEAETNLAIGVHHVYRLLGRYKNPIFVLTSYNANPSATKRWMRTIPTDDFLTFIEKIPYGETRSYVKLVLRNYFYYQRWYDGPSLIMQHMEPLAKNIQLKSKKARKK